MKKLLRSLILILCFSSLVAAKQSAPVINNQYAFTAAAATSSVNIIGRGISYWVIKSITHEGSLPSACTAVLQTSSDNSTWATGISLDCSTNTESAITALNTAYVRVNVSTLTRVNNSTTTINIVGYIESPTGSSTSPGDVNVIGGVSTVIANTTANGADAISNTAINGLNALNFPTSFNGTTWDRIRGGTDGTSLTGVISVNQRAFSFSHIATNTTTTSKSGAGVLHTITVNTKGITNTFTCYDNTAGSGTVIAILDTTLAQDTLTYDLVFATGLTCVTAGGTAADLTVTYR